MTFSDQPLCSSEADIFSVPPPRVFPNPIFCLFQAQISAAFAFFTLAPSEKSTALKHLKRCHRAAYRPLLVRSELEEVQEDFVDQ